MPSKMVGVYKEFIDLKLLDEICMIISKITAGTTEIQRLAIEVASAVVHPYYGEVYSFPWKRGPHSAVLEYNENMNNFDVLRETIFGAFTDFSWTTKLTLAYKEFFDEHTIT